MKFKTFLRLLIQFFFRVKVEGSLPAILPDKKIYICNHQSMIDAMIISLFINDSFYFVMDKEIGTKKPFSWDILKNKKNFLYFLRNRFTQFIIRFVNVIKVDTKSPHSLKKMISVVNEGKSLLIFPEGKITKTGMLEKIQPGVWFLVKKTQATIIPLKLSGLLTSHFSYMDIKKNIRNDVKLEIINPMNIHSLSSDETCILIQSILS